LQRKERGADHEEVQQRFAKPRFHASMVPTKGRILPDATLRWLTGRGTTTPFCRGRRRLDTPETLRVTSRPTIKEIGHEDQYGSYARVHAGGGLDCTRGRVRRRGRVLQGARAHQAILRQVIRLRALSHDREGGSRGWRRAWRWPRLREGQVHRRYD